MVTPPYHKQIIYLQEIDAYVEKFKINKSVLVLDHTVGKMDRCAQGGRLFCIFILSTENIFIFIGMQIVIHLFCSTVFWKTNLIRQL